MSEILAAQYHRLVTVSTPGTGSGCFADCPVALQAVCCQFTAEPFPGLCSWPEGLIWPQVPSSRMAVHIQRPVNVEAQRPGPLVTSWQSSKASSYIIHRSCLRPRLQLNCSLTFLSTQSHGPFYLAGPLFLSCPVSLEAAPQYVSCFVISASEFVSLELTSGTGPFNGGTSPVPILTLSKVHSS